MRQLGRDIDLVTQAIALQNLTQGKVSKTFMDNTLPPAEGTPRGPTERTVEYQPPFFKPDREEDYRVAWGVFAAAVISQTTGEY